MLSRSPVLAMTPLWRILLPPGRKVVAHRSSDQYRQKRLHSGIGESGPFALDENPHYSRVGRCPPAPAPLDDLDDDLIHQPRTIRFTRLLGVSELPVGLRPVAETDQ
jgi:hypothetical protein